MDRPTRRGRFRPEALDTEPPCPRPLPAAASDERENVRMALAAMDELPPRQRQVLYLVTCENMAHDEVATILGISDSAVKANLSLARKEMRLRLKEIYEAVCGRQPSEQIMNSNSNCNNLDAYLSDDLSGDERAIFESHLEECATCRDAVDEQQWIDDLLQSPERTQLERPSATILDSFRVSIAQRRRRVVQATCGLAAAATLLIAVGLLAAKPTSESGH